MRKLILILALSGAAFAAIPANTVWEVRPSTGSDANGGGFLAGVGTASPSSSATLAIDATSPLVVTSSAYNFVAADVGKWIKVTAGTNWTAGWYQIKSTANNAATLDLSPSAAGNGNLGTYSLYPGIDYSQQGAARVVIDNSAITASCATNTITFTGGYTPTAADQGNFVNLTATSGVTAGWYEISGYSSTTWTLAGAASACTSGPNSGAVGKMGGALQTLGQLAAAMVASNKAFVKAETVLSISSGVTFTQSVSPPGQATPATKISGYSSTRGDGGHATAQLSSSASGAVSMITFSGSGVSLEGFDIDCNSAGNPATSTGVTVGYSYSRLTRIKISNCTSRNLYLSYGGYLTVMDSEFTGATSTASASVSAANNSTVFFLRNYVHDNATTGFNGIGGGHTIAQNVFYNNLGATSDGILIGGFNYGPTIVTQNTIDSSGRHALNYAVNNAPSHPTYDNVFSNWGLSVSGGAGHGLVGVSVNGVPAMLEYDGNCYYVGSSTGAGSPRSLADDTTFATVNGITPYRNQYDQVLTASPYKNAPTDFSLNAAAGGGAACIGAGLPQAFPGLAGTAGHTSMGAVGINAASSAGGNLVVVR
jgi:hypothetical protein